MRTVPRLCGFYPGICLTTEEKARKNLRFPYSTLIPRFGRAIPFCWCTKSWDFMVGNLSVTLNSLSKYQSIDIQHRSLVAADVRDRIYKQARLQNLSWIFVCAAGICWSRSSCKFIKNISEVTPLHYHSFVK